MDSNGQVSIFLGCRDSIQNAKLPDRLAEFEELKIVGIAHNVSDILVNVGTQRPDVLIFDAAMLNTSVENFGKVIRSGSDKTKILLMDYQGTLQEFLPLFQYGIFGNCASTASSYLMRIALLSVIKGCVWFQPGLSVLPNKVSPLSNREKEVLKLVMSGHRNATIAELLQISPETVKSHMHRMMEKFVVRSRTQLVVEAIRQQVC
ncbi:MAG TPA: response regulator transcription factor [Drouetiella sp.]